MMKRNRVFIQNEPGWVTESVIIALIVFGAQVFGLAYLLYGCISGFPSVNGDIAHYAIPPVVFLFAPLVMYPEVISRFSWNVHLGEQKVWMKGDWIAAKWFRVQLPVEVSYSKIVSMVIEQTSKNSSGQSIRAWFYGPLWSQKRYLTLIDDQGKKKRLHVSHYTDALLAEIIDTIVQRCEMEGDKYDGRRAAQILFNQQD